MKLLPFSELGERLKEVRKLRGVTVRQAAKEIGLISHATINYIETGYIKQTSLEYQYKISEWIGMNVDENAIIAAGGDALKGIEAALQKDKILTAEAAASLLNLMQAAYREYAKA